LKLSPIESNRTCALAGAGVNQAAGRQLAIAGLNNRLTDGGKFVSLTSWQRFPPGIFLVQFSVRGRIDLSKLNVRSIKKYDDIGSRTHGLRTGFEIFITVTKEATTFQDMTQCILVEV
jgi:hypothetical protein